ERREAHRLAVGSEGQGGFLTERAGHALERDTGCGVLDHGGESTATAGRARRPWRIARPRWEPLTRVGRPRCVPPPARRPPCRVRCQAPLAVRAPSARSGCRG